MANAAFLDPVRSSVVDLSAASERQPPGTVAILFRRVPVLGVPRAWRNVKIELHTQVHLRPTDRPGIVVYAPMRSGFAARFLGQKLRAMGELPPARSCRYASCQTCRRGLTSGPARRRATAISAPSYP